MNIYGFLLGTVISIFAFRVAKDGKPLAAAILVILYFVVSYFLS